MPRMGLLPNQRDHSKSDLFALVLVSVNRGVVQTAEDVAAGVANPRVETPGGSIRRYCCGVQINAPVK